MSPSSQPNESLTKPRTSALAISQFRWLVASNLAFFIAMHGQVLTRSFLVWELTQDEMSLAYINISFAVPMVLFSAIGGALVDRFERRTVAQIAQLIVIVNEAIVLLLIMTGQIQFWHLLAAGCIGGIVIPVIMASRTALVFNVVGDALLSKATGLTIAVINICRVLGPLVMGVVIAGLSVSAAYAFAVILFALAFLLLFWVQKKPVASAQSTTVSSLVSEVKEGIHYVWYDRTIRSSIAFSFMIMLLVMPLQNLFILFTDNVWRVGEAGLGLLMSIAGVGGVAGSLWAAARSEHKQRLRPMINGSICLAICFAAFSLSPSFYLALIPLAIANLFASSVQTLNNTAIQLLVDDKQRGRVSSFMMMTYGFTPLGVLPLAWAAKFIGIQWSVFIGSVALIAAVVLFRQISPSLRDLDETVKKRRQNISRKKPLNSPIALD